MLAVEFGNDQHGDQHSYRQPHAHHREQAELSLFSGRACISVTPPAVVSKTVEPYTNGRLAIIWWWATLVC